MRRRRPGATLLLLALLTVLHLGFAAPRVARGDCPAPDPIPPVVDTDEDGLPDAVELATGTDPTDPDSDDDGLNDGDERFQVRASTDAWPTVELPSYHGDLRRIVVADFDGDGDLDFVVAKRDPGSTLQEDSLFRYVEMTEAGPEPAVALGTERPGLPVAMQVVDLDGDMDLDVVHLNEEVERDEGVEASFEVQWHENLGDGNFEFRTIDSGGGGDDTSGVDVTLLIADLDGQNGPDLVWSGEIEGVEGYGIRPVWKATEGGASFALAQQITTEFGERIFAAAAFDLDGDLDLLSQTDAGLQWIEMQDASPVEHHLIAANEFDDAIALDVDGDGDPDALSSSQSLGMQWHRNDAGGCFDTPQSVAAAPATLYGTFDVDGDGDPDPLSRGSSTGQWHENAAGSFHAGRLVFADLTVLRGHADIDADGDLDAMSIGRRGSIRFHLNPGTDPNDEDSDDDLVLDGQEVLDGTDPLDPDTDRDGLDDAAEASAGTDPLDADSDDDGLSDGEEVSEYGSDPLRSDTDGDLIPDPVEARYGLQLTIADADADPDADGASNAEELAAITHPRNPDTDGDGLFDGAEVVAGTDPRNPDTDGDLLEDGYEVAWGLAPLSADDPHVDTDEDGLSHLGEQAAGTDPTLPDTDADGETDFEEVTRARGTVFGPIDVVQEPAPTSTFGELAALDADGDGDTDLVTIEAEGFLFENSDGRGHFLAPVPIGEGGTRHVVVADIDEDLDPDLVIYRFDEISWLENEGGAFAEPQSIVALHAERLPDLGDVDGDGDVDVAYSVAWRRNESLGVFTPQPGFSISPSENRAHLADLDGDGDLDLLSSSDLPLQGLLRWFENADGLGAFSSPATLVENQIRDVHWIETADLDLDGDLDVLRAAQGTDGLVWYENTDGSGSFGSRQPFAGASEGVDIVQASDVDRDGDPDVVAATFSSGVGLVSWWENLDGLGTFGSRQDLYSTERRVVAIVCSDLDGDGDEDVAGLDHLGTLFWLPNPGSDPLSVPEPDGPLGMLVVVASVWGLASRRGRASPRPMHSRGE